MILILIIPISAKLLDAYTSLKYEVDEPWEMSKVTGTLNDKEEYLKDFIT